MGITIAATIFVFSLIVFVHELGHFVTAKLAGMQVDEFAIGFGPKIYSYTSGETMYSLRAIPLGGFNKIAGMTEEEPLNERSFLNKSVGSRLVVIAAGACMNFVLAILLFWGVFFVNGTMTVSEDTVIGSVMEQSAASQAALQAGDKILSIGGEKVTQWEDVPKAVAAHSREVVAVVIERDGVQHTMDVIPQLEEGSKRAVIGVMPVISRQRYGFLESGYMAVSRTGQICSLMVSGLYDMITGREKAEVAGPLGVAQLAGQMAEVGFINLLMFTAILSLNLGIINLLPVPLLDGGYIILLIIEGITRRRMPKKALYYIQVCGMVVLGALFIFAMFQDISRIGG